MSAVCEPSHCAMCNACVNICPKNCISKVRVGSQFYMVIDEERCISCHRCETVCPNHTEPRWEESKAVYASWALDQDVRMTSASGGVASTLYRWAIDNGFYAAGAAMDEGFEVHFRLTKDPIEVQTFRNSKYAFSFADEIYKDVISVLRDQGGVVFVGLPCQVAGLKNYARAMKVDSEKLYTVDLICHGTPMPDYLTDHIKAIEKDKGFKAEECYFRDPAYGSENFIFTLYDGNLEKPLYKKAVISDDLYQIGYHNGWIYRDSCYQCPYAQRKRCGDLSLGDSHGLGKTEAYSGPEDNVSFCFVNTDKGKQVLSRLVKGGFLHAEKRPLEEPYRYEPQLSHPSRGKDSFERKTFLSNYNGSYEPAAAIAFKDRQADNQKKEMLHVYEIKKGISRMVPRSVKRFIRKHR